MELEGIREAVRKQPFQPFTLCLADGRRLHIGHPEFVAVPSTGRRVAVFVDGKDTLSLVEPLFIVSIEYGMTDQAVPPHGPSTN